MSSSASHVHEQPNPSYTVTAKATPSAAFIEKLAQVHAEVVRSVKKEQRGGPR